jgi:hypothetical protein
MVYMQAALDHLAANGHHPDPARSSDISTFLGLMTSRLRLTRRVAGSGPMVSIRGAEESIAELG